MIVHSAPMRDIVFLVHRVGKFENFPRYLEYNCGNFKIDLKNVFLIRFSPCLPAFRFMQSEFFFLEKTSSNTFALFSVKLFKFELGLISNIYRCIYDSALGTNERQRFFGSRKSENFPRYLEYDGGNFEIDLENVFLIRFSPRMPTFRFVLRQNFFFSQKNTKGQSLCTFFGEIFPIRVGPNFEHLQVYL